MIKHVRITNFKSLGDVAVDLDPVTVLIGRSGTGKSNFVAALRFLRDYLAQGAVAVERHHGGWERILCATVQKAEMSFTIVFNVDGVLGDYQYDLRFQGSREGPPPLAFWEEQLTLGDTTLFHQQEGRWVTPPKMIKAPGPGKPMLGALTGIQEIAIAYLFLTRGIGCYDFPGTVLLSGGRPEGGETGLLDSAENYVRTFDTIIGNLQKLNHWREILASLRRLNPSTKSVELAMPDRSRIAVGHDVGGRILVFDLDQEAEGFRRFLAYLIALYQSPPKQVLVFEEPEKGIHPGALSVLAEQFRACPEAGRGQVILTTHSPQLLDYFEPEMLRVVEMHNSLTQIGPVTPEQVEAIREHLLSPGELLTVDPARLATSATS
ncbi:MAG: AAA family ATPase [Gemmataceae bacterium]|nr:AAA family ATPase [Gemmataceae bacterium]